MEFMEMLEEWLNLRDLENAEDERRSIPERRMAISRMEELEQEINKRMRGEL